MSGTTPLTGNGTLFRFNMNTFLSSNNEVIPVPCGLIQNRPYVLIDCIPGHYNSSSMRKHITINQIIRSRLFIIAADA
jgi:hypothetical protein